MRDDKVLGSTVRLDLTTHDSTGALVAPSSAFAASDFRIYKDGSATEKVTTNGITVTSPFDSIVGKHLIEIDTGNSTGDVGFWASGSEYRVELNSAKTISSIVQSGVVVGRFALVVAGVLRPTVDGRTLVVSAGGAGDAALDTETQTQLQAIEDGVDANTGYLTALTAALSALAAKVRKYFQLSLRKDAAIATDNAAELAELNASGGSGAGSYLSTTDSQEAIRDSIAGVISSAIASAGVATTVTGIPTFLRVGDARTVANGGAIAVRLYDADDDSLLFGLGTQLFADATITFSLRRGGNDGTEGTEDAVIPCTWVASGGDGYVRIAYEGDALDDCDAMDKLKEKDCHRWGIKFQWGDDDPITPVYGTVSVLRKIVSTQ